MRRWLVLACVFWGLSFAQAQDGLNLPTQLYILRNEGIIERYGVGVEGVSIVSDETDFILDFSVAPDGNWLAYRTLDGLYLMNLYESGLERQIEGETAGLPDVRGRGSTMAWSPRSDVLAYTTEDGARFHFFLNDGFSDIDNPGLFNLIWSPDGRYVAAEAEGGVWWLYAMRDGAAVLTAAIPESTGLTWVTATQVLFAPPEGGLVLLDLVQENQQIEVLDSEQRYYLPQRLQDNRVRVLVGEPNAARLQEIQFVGGQPVVEDAGVSFVDPANVRWSPDGALLTVFQGGALALIDPVSGGGFTLPISTASAFSWGPTYPLERDAQPLPNSVTLLADDIQGVSQVWRLPRDGSAPLQLTAASNPVVDYALAPDNLQVAYVSNSGLWITPLGDVGNEIVQLGINEGVNPAWSSDGSVLYYRDEQAEGDGIWRYDVAQADNALFISDEADAQVRRVLPSRDVAALLVERADGLYILDMANDDLYSLGLAGTGFWSGGTEIIARGVWNDIDGLYRYDANIPGDPSSLLLPLDNDLTLLDYRLINETTVRALVRATNPGEIRVTDLLLAGGAPRIVANAGYLTTPHLSPDGRFVLGTTRPGGRLLVYDVEANRSASLPTLTAVRDIRWQRN